MLASGRHYATREAGRRLRKYKVMRSEVTRVRQGQQSRWTSVITYRTASRHWTAKGAQERADRLNRENRNTP